MADYQVGDYIKAEFKDDQTGESEWMWVKVQGSDDQLRVVFGELDNEPITLQDLCLGMQLAVSYDNVREHRSASSFKQ
jgi:hypothetical protein